MAQDTPKTVEELVALWPKPSPQTLAAAIGLAQVNVYQWRRRGNIPVGNWPRVMDAARALGRDDITAAALLEINGNSRPEEVA